MRGLAPLFFSFILDFYIDIINMDKRNDMFQIKCPERNGRV